MQALQSLCDGQANGLPVYFIFQGLASVTHGRAAHISDAIQVMNEEWEEIGADITVKCWERSTCSDAEI